MSKPCLYRLPNGSWIHYSRGTHKVFVRNFIRGDREEEYPLSADDPKQNVGVPAGAMRVTIAEANARLVEINLGLDLRTLRYTEVEAWQKVFAALKDVDWETALVPDAPAPTPVPGNLALIHAIPQTRLRRFYECQRLLPGTEVHGTIASYLSKSPARAKTLQVLFSDSVTHFARYRNIGEPFHNPDQERQPLGAATAEVRRLVSQLISVGQPSLGISDGDEPLLSSAAVAYEISPFRTTSAAFGEAPTLFESGRSSKSSGQGGIDLLLRSDDKDLPIIAEIKGRKDTDLFLALIQALTYASEMMTPNQIERLNKQFGEHFHLNPQNAQCDIYLIYLEEKKRDLKQQTIALAKALLSDRNSPVARVVRRIAFVHAAANGTEPFVFRCDCLCEAPPLST
jgi:hypothetical protein